ncbi:MAG: hypothetical protein ACOC8B_05815 [Gemmatimonadota bacterium]
MSSDALAERIGAPVTVAIGGTIAIGASAVVARLLPALREEVRARYAER